MTEHAEAGEGRSLPAARIQLLEDRLINQIAAGEVVERPASVVKELVENALDAGASHLRVTLRAGGRDLIQVEDDGAGMGRQDAMLCVERHATSKIRSARIFFAIETLGFRGEALPSIAAVSRFELTTRREVDAVGTRVVIDGGRMVDVRDAGCPVGTKVVVRTLFTNLPARRKFLRTVQTELSHCQEAVLRELLIRPEVGVELFHDGRALVRAAAGNNPAVRAEALLGRDASELVPVAFEDPLAACGLEARGLVSPPGVHRGSARGALWLYVNGRAVRDPLLRRAVLDAWRGLVPRGRYPTVVLAVRVPPDRVDVNVHPAKTEVRFRDGRDVSRAVTEGLRQALSDHGIQPQALTPKRGLPPGVADDGAQAALPGLMPPVLEQAPAPPPPPQLLSESTAPTRQWVRPLPPPVLPDDRPLPPPPEFQRSSPATDDTLRLVGQAGRWLICSKGSEIVLVDLQRAHAQTIDRALRDSPEARPLLAPVLSEVGDKLHDAVAARPAPVAALGIELEPFGGGTLALRGMPAALGGADPQALTVALAQGLADGLDIDQLRARVAELAAVQPGRHLSPYEQKGLVDGLDLDAPGLCVRLCGDELQRRLGR